MSDQKTEDIGKRGSSLGLTLGSIAAVCAINLLILAYAVELSNQHSSASEPAAPPGAATNGGAGAATSVRAPTTGVGSGVPPGAAIERATVVNPVALPETSVTIALYTEHCSACHGPAGRGDGPAAAQLYPRPRDFVDSPFRFVPLGGSQEQRVSALERTIGLGVARSSMPGFTDVLTETAIAGLARYVYSMHAVVDSGTPDDVADPGRRPPTTPGLIEQGRKLFVAHDCISCHGERGHGDGPKANTLVDSVGRPVRPADLASGLFKSGQQPDDLCRTILRGIPGTPMLGFEAVLAKQNADGTRNLTEVWALVAYISSLNPKHEPPGKSSGAELRSEMVTDSSLLLDPSHPGWLGVQHTEIVLKPLWQREETITSLSVRVVRSDEQIALCFDWRDPSLDAARDHASFSDAVAVMFAMGDSVPALPMGVEIKGFKPAAPVNIWHWQADRQRVAATGVESPAAHPLDAPAGAEWQVFKPLLDFPVAIPAESTIASGFLPSFRTAQGAGNVHEDTRLRGVAVLESNAEGFGTLKLQPAEVQQVHGSAVWSRGLWRVVMARALVTDDINDVKLTERPRVAIAFAVWDGSKGDCNGIKLISGWHWLVVPSTRTK